MRKESEIIQRAQHEWMEFKEVQLSNQKEEEKMIHEERQQEWQPAEMGTIKLNVSFECDKNCISVGIGIIARDTDKQCVQA